MGCLGLGNKKHLLVIGPLYKATGRSEAKNFSEGAGQKILDCFHDFYRETCEQKSLTSPISNQRMQRMLLARIALPSGETQARIKKSVAALTAITKSLWLDKGSYRSAECFAVARAYISVCRWRSKLWAMKKHSCDLSLYFSLPYRDQDKDKNQDENFLRLTIKLHKIEGRQGLTIQNGVIIQSQSISFKDNEFGGQNFLCAMHKIIDDKDIRCEQDNLGELNLNVARWEERMASRRRYFQNLSADMLQNWLQDHSSELYLSASNEGKNNKAILCDYICSTILDDLRGDVCHLYKFEQKNNQVKLLGAAYSKIYKKSDIDSLRRQMENIDDSDKSKSAVFRCIDTKYTLNYEVSEDNGKPNFLLYAKTGLETQSGILSPIVYQGRIWGVLEVTGLVPYQFSWTHQYALSNIVSILNTHFYEQYLHFSLKGLTRLALEDKHNNPKALEVLSDLLSSIFLCQGATVWLKHKDENESYTLYGTNIDELTERDTDLFKDSMTIRKSNTDDCESVMLDLRAKYIELGENYLIGDLSDGNSGLVRSRPHRRKLHSLGLKEVMVFTLTKEVTYASKENREASLLGFVTLHHTQPWGYPKNWQNVIDLVNGQLVVALEMLDALQDKEDDIMALLHHEIKQDANTLRKIPHDINLLMDSLISRKNKTEKYIREVKLISKKISMPDGEKNYGNLVNKLYNNNEIILPEVTAISKKLPNMRKIATLLDEKINLLIFSKKNGVTLGDLFGESGFDVNDPIEKIDLHEMCKDVFSAKRKDCYEKGMHIDIDAIHGYKLKGVRVEILNNFIQNLIDNAIKYGDENSSISIDIDRSRSVSYYLFSFSNY